ncbi:MAG: potassium-transporting ATPase subunit F [Thermoplasmata archaeon]|nr:potassium-transporting ATPase subunit F [Thermoplasmata archaeon]
MTLSFLAPHLGLILFTVLTFAITLYLVYSMLRPDRF